MADDILAPVADEIDSGPMRVNAASAMQPNKVSRGQEEAKAANLAEEARTMGVPDSAIPIVGDLNVWAERFDKTVAKAWLYGDNAAVQMVYDFNRIDGSGPEDPAWKSGNNKKWLDQRGGNIDATNQWRYMQTRNQVEAEQLLADSNENSKQQQLLNARSDVAPFSTFAGRMIAGMVDVDLPFTLMAGGIGPGIKAGIHATKLGRLLSGAAGGAMAGAGTQTGAYYANPDEDWTSIPIAGFMGMGLGLVGGALAKSPHINEKVSEPANVKLNEVVQEYNDTLEDGMPQGRSDYRTEVQASPDGLQRQAQEAQEALAAEEAANVPGAARTPQAINVDDIEAPTGAVEDIQGPGSVGAAQVGTGSPSISTLQSPRVVERIQEDRSFNATTGHEEEFHGNYNALRAKNDALARGASRFQAVVDKIGIGSDFNKLMRSGSAVASRMAYELFENASGKVRNNRSGAMLMDNYQKQILGNFLPYHDAYTEFATARGAGMWQRIWNPQLRRDFDIEIIQELNARHYNGNYTSPPDLNPAVKKAADAVDRTFAKEIEVGKGRDGEGSWKGFEELTQKSGYFPQKWVGYKMRALVNDARYGHAGLVQAVREAYRMQHVNMKDSDASIWAAAMVNRALRQDDGLTTNLVSVLQADGRAMLEDTLRANGIKDKEIKRLIDGLTGNMEEVGKPGQTKQRIDVDMRFVASNGIKMIDLIDTDINKIVGQRARRTAGQGALARKGIYSRQDWEDRKEAIIAEQSLKQQEAGTGIRERAENALDNDTQITAEYMDDLYTYFSGSPLAGGLSPAYARMRKLTNLSLLNQLGMTQLAEFGPMIAAVGWKRFAEHAGEAFNARLGKPDSELVQELKHMNIFVPEENMFRDDFTFDSERMNPNSGEYMQRFDSILNKAQRVQGFTSGFYEVRKIQQRIALTSGIDKLISGIKSGKEQFSPDRLRDMGFDPKLMAKISKYVNDGTVKFGADGNLLKLDLEKWDWQDAEGFTLAMNRQTNILVQKAMAGESSILFHKDGVASLFFHLKSFPLLAMEKQAMRNVNMADQTAMNTFVYGMVTAGAAYTARQVINANTDNLTASRIATGAIGLSNMTGWVPMWSDPIAGLLGLDSLQMGGGKYGANSIISLPAALTTLDRLAQAPSALVNAINPFDELKNGDIRAIQTIPLIGNLYGINAMLNLLKN